MSHLATGRTGEDAAVQHYLNSGYEVLARNWRTRLGELDLIVCMGTLLVFCEVKSRKGFGYGTPAEALTAAKRHRIRRLAENWMAIDRRRWDEVRFDVVEVLISGGDRTEVRRIEAAF
ncbi:MAG: YraN family protein [Acidobacteria bacterium]|nr:MAG: YraN family protein [Acidobacteriota bacterium]